MEKPRGQPGKTGPRGSDSLLRTVDGVKILDHCCQLAPERFIDKM